MNMSKIRIRTRATARLAVMTITGLMMVTAHAQTILVDLGNKASYRGAPVTNPDANGKHWNSVDASTYWAKLVDSDGTATSVGFGFEKVGGTDSYNGPAGTDTTPSMVDVETAALGALGANAAVFDYYVSSSFCIQGLDPAKTYTLTFFGSCKFAEEPTTVYTVYSNKDYAQSVASAELQVCQPESPWLHNRDKVAVIQNVSPQEGNSIWIKFAGKSGGKGYLNSLLIQANP